MCTNRRKDRPKGDKDKLAHLHVIYSACYKNFPPSDDAARHNETLELNMF